MSTGIETERLRQELMDYFGTAVMGGSVLATPELLEVEEASLDELVQIAQRAGIDLSRFAHEK